MYKILEGCPQCRQYPVRLSRLRGPLERLRQTLTGKSPHRCVACGWRGWANETYDRRQRTDLNRALGRRKDDRKPPVQGER